MKITKRLKDERGQAILEAAVMLPVLIFVALAMIDIQVAESTAGSLSYVVTEVARCEAIAGLPCNSPNNAGLYANQLAYNLRLRNGFAVASYGCDEVSGSCTMVASYSYKPLGVWFPQMVITRTGTASIKAGG
jgi:hypothetical protein